jgi:GntR family transcriptional regulator
MLPFKVEIRSGESPYRQLVYAATKAIVSGELPPGSPFPSVRTLSQSLKINPNTAQKAVGEMLREGLLEKRPGIGTLVAEWGPASAGERAALLREELERFLVEARRLGLTLPEVENAVGERWNRLFPEGVGPRGVDTEPDAKEKDA